jgi:competence protein ComGC
MWARVMKTIRNKNGRNPRGYGLPSLVVILFFVSILIQAVIGEMVRQTSEAKAEAAFSIAKENLDTFKITSDLPNTADMPHLSAGSRYVSVSRTGGLVNVQFDDPDERASRLFDQKLRGYVNIENSQNIGTLSPSEIRREYPERILRSGDRMATNLTSDTIGNANTMRTGTGDADYADTNRFTGIETTLIETNRFRVARLRTDKTVVENATTTNNMTANESVVSDIVNVTGGSGHGTYGNGELLVNHIRYPSLTPAQQVSDIDIITVSGQLASANGLDGIDGITFENLIASGVRVADLYTDMPINGVPANPDDGGTGETGGSGDTGGTGGGDPGTGGTGGGDPGTGGTGGSGGQVDPGSLTPD